MKIAILGTENTHASNFSASLCPKEGKKLFDDIELIGVYGDEKFDIDGRGIENIKKVSGCKYFAKHYNDFLNEADGIMVTARHGACHLMYVEEYIKRGIPVWIDKPITACPDDALRLIDLAKAHNVPLCGGSSLVHCEEILKMKKYVQGKSIIGGNVSAPINMNNAYGNFWFYSQHLVEMLVSVFGYEIKSVEAKRHGETVSALYHYEDFDVTAFFGGGYSVTVYTGNYEAETVSVVLNSDYYIPELIEFHDMLKSKKMPKSYEKLIAPVFVIDATIRAFEGCKAVDIVMP